MTKEEFLQIKSLIKEAIAQRDGVGNGRRPEDGKFGDLTSYNGSAYDITDKPQKNKPVALSQGEKTMGILYECFSEHITESGTYAEDVGDKPGLTHVVRGAAIKNFNLDFVQNVVRTLKAEKAASNGASESANKTDVGTLEPEHSSCNAACSGLCVGSCISFCNGCTGCTGSCGSGCNSGSTSQVGY